MNEILGGKVLLEKHNRKCGGFLKNIYSLVPTPLSMLPSYDKLSLLLHHSISCLSSDVSWCVCSMGPKQRQQPHAEMSETMSQNEPLPRKLFISGIWLQQWEIDSLIAVQMFSITEGLSQEMRAPVTLLVLLLKSNLNCGSLHDVLALIYICKYCEDIIYLKRLLLRSNRVVSTKYIANT